MWVCLKMLITPFHPVYHQFSHYLNLFDSYEFLYPPIFRHTGPPVKRPRETGRPRILDQEEGG